MVTGTIPCDMCDNLHMLRALLPLQLLLCAWLAAAATIAHLRAVELMTGNPAGTKPSVVAGHLCGAAARHITEL